MIPQRQGWRRVLPEPHATWEKENKCPQCGKPRPEWKRRTDWKCCSSKCSALFFHDNNTIHSWAELRGEALCRDQHRCVKCGSQPTAIMRSGYEGTKKVLKRYYDPLWRGEMAVVVEGLAVDHIKPIALGGEEFDLQNLQTLCSVCHKIKTKRDVAQIAKRRKIEQMLKGNQRTL